MDETSHNPLISTSLEAISMKTTLSQIDYTIACSLWGTSLAQSLH